MGGLRIFGATVLIVGIVGFVGGFFALGADPAGASSAFLVNELIAGLAWGPLLIAIGLVLLTRSGRREEATIPS